MAWNRPTEEKVKAKGEGEQRSVHLKGLFAGAVVVLGAVAVWWMTRPSDGVAESDDEGGNAKIAERHGGDRGTTRPAEASGMREKAQPVAREVSQTGENGAQVADEAVVPEGTNGVAKAVKKDTRLFKNQMDQLMAMVMPKRAGEAVPPVPIDDNMKFSEEDEKKILERLTADENDTDEQLERKEIVQAMRDEYFDLKKRGWTFVDYIKALQAKADLDNEVLVESLKIHETVFNDKSISDEEYKKTLGEINKVLTDRGIAPIDPNKDEEEATEDTEGEKSK